MRPVPSDDSFVDEDSATLAAIRRGLRDSDAGRVVPIEEVRAMIPRWIAKYSIPEPE